MLTVTVDGEPPGEGIAAAARLMDSAVADGQVVRMTKRRPPDVHHRPHAPSASRLAAMLPESTLDELRRNNQDLIAALEDVTQQKEQLLLLNAELQETNRGVMALYSELSEELEQTNRGVVALYRGAGREVRAAAGRVGVQGPVLGQRQPRAAHAAELDHRADPAAGRAGRAASAPSSSTRWG